MKPEDMNSLILRLPELLKHSDDDGNFPDFIGVGASSNGDWQVMRWIGGDPFDENGPIGENKDLGEALKEAFKTFEPRCYFCNRWLDLTRKVRIFQYHGKLQYCCVNHSVAGVSEPLTT